MRPCPPSTVVKTDAEIRSELADAMKSKREIEAEIDARQKNAAEVQSRYNKTVSAPFEASLSQKSGGKPPLTVWDKA